MFRVTLLGCLLSKFLLVQFSTGDVANDEGSRCSTIATTLERTSCETYQAWHKAHPNDTDCITQILESKRVYDLEKHQAYSNLTYEYCSNTTKAQECSDCLSKAFYDFYNRSFCLYVDTSRIDQVKECLSKYNSTKFDWSRKVIFENYEKEEDLTSTPYHDCSFQETEIPKSKKVNFPVYLRLVAEIYDKVLNILLSLFLEAYEVQNQNNSPGVTCQHIKDTKLLLAYKSLSEKKIKYTPLEVNQSYSNLRRSMCQGSENESSCMECFNKTDETFLFHVNNMDAKVSSMRRDFLHINASLHNCLQRFPSQNFSSLLKLTKNLEGSWNATFGDCLTSKSKEDLGFIEKNVQSIEYIGQNEAVVRSVGLNYFGFHIYQDLQTNKSTISCDDVNQSLILCTAWNTIQSITIHSRHHQTEDEQMENLGIDIGRCGEPVSDQSATINKTEKKKKKKNKKNKSGKNSKN